MSANPASKKAKRPPRTFWITYSPLTGTKLGDFARRSEANEEALRTGRLVAGPYVLAERVSAK